MNFWKLIKRFWYFILGVPVIIAFIFIPHTDELSAKVTLEKKHYKVIEVGGYSWTTQARKGDWYRTKFKAIAINGDTVSGAVTKPLGYGSNLIIED